MQALHQRSISDPDNWTSLLSDWSNPHLMPHMARLPKGWMSKTRLKYHVFGLMNYGTQKLILYPHFDYWTHDANLHISFLWCYLKNCFRANLPLGKNLMIQMDNCFKDNKNKFLLGFLASLVARKMFKVIEVYYLQPGHSHDMVDFECFGPMGRKARHMYDFLTPEEFWNNFVARSFARRKKKPEFLSNVCV